MKVICNLLITFFFLSVLCSCKDSEEYVPEIKIVPELSLEGESVKVLVDSEIKIEITQGGDEYNVFSLDPDIASVTIEDKILTVKGIIGGNTFIIISDESGQYKRIPVLSYYDKLILDKEKIDMKIPVGKPRTTVVNVLLGNGGYSVSSNNQMIQASVTEEGVITVTCLAQSDSEEATGTVTITDVVGLSTVFTVHITISTNPYTEEQMAEILRNKARRYIFNNADPVAENWWDPTYKNIQENGRITYSWDYYGYYFMLSFDGDRSEGKKVNAKLSCDYYLNGYIRYSNQIINLEIVQNDGTNIWAVYSFNEGETLKYGYFCETINPK